MVRDGQFVVFEKSMQCSVCVSASGLGCLYVIGDHNDENGQTPERRKAEIQVVLPCLNREDFDDKTVPLTVAFDYTTPLFGNW